MLEKPTKQNTALSMSKGAWLLSEDLRRTKEIYNSKVKRNAATDFSLYSVYVKQCSRAAYFYSGM